MTPQQQEAVRQQDLKRLESMVDYCKTKDCLRGTILSYFGQNHPDICGNCGNCKGDFEAVDITRDAQMILSCVKRVQDRLGYSVGLNIISKTLRGSRDKQIQNLGLDDLSTYGLMSGKTMSELRSMTAQLESDGYLVFEPEHQTLQLTAKAAQVLYQGKQVQMLVRKEPDKPMPQAASEVSLTGIDADLYEVLKELRARLAHKSNVPAYVVFSNATLQDMAKKKPRTMLQFKQVSGVGELKSSWYGKDFLTAIQTFLSSNS